MKPILFYCSLLLAFLLAEATQAQTIIKDSISVNGLMVGNKYTQEQFTKALGTPTKIIPPAYEDVYPDTYTFCYGKDRFFLIGGEFYGFEIRTNVYVFNNLITVGDSISKIDQLGGVIEIIEHDDKVRVIHWKPSDKGLYEWASVSFYTDENNIIKDIFSFISDL